MQYRDDLFVMYISRPEKNTDMCFRYICRNN